MTKEKIFAFNYSMFKNIKKILVIKLRHIGDVLLTVPTIRALKETFYDAGVSVLVNPGTEDVLSGNALIDELIVLDRAVKNLPIIKRYIEEAMFLKKIRTKGFDMTVDLTGGDRAAILSFLSGARYRLAADFGRKGFIGKKYLYTHLADVDKQKHMVLQNLDVVRNFGITTDNTDVDFFIPEEAKMFVRRIFEENNLSKSNNSPSPPFAKGGAGGVMDKVVHIHPTSRWLFKCWKDEYMADVIGWLIDNGVKVVVTSAPDEKEITKARGILSLIPNPQSLIPNLIDLSGKTTIKELAAISEASDLFIGVDSAPMHIAAAVGTPVIALFGPTGREWIPYGEGNTVISKDMPCKPCKKGMCEGIELRDCMTAIKPNDVKEAVNKILKEIL
mgnify:CR=1 FL=1